MSIPLFILLVLIEFLLIGTVFTVAYFTYRGLISVPWVRTNQNISRAMLELAGVREGEIVLDLGSGDGSIVLEAVKGFDARGIGVEQLGSLVLLSKLRARLWGIQNRTQFLKGNIFSMDMPKADVITTYLFNEVNLKLEPVLLKHFPSKTRVVSREFVFPGFTHIKTIPFKKSKLHLYELP